MVRGGRDGCRSVLVDIDISFFAFQIDSLLSAVEFLDAFFIFEIGSLLSAFAFPDPEF